MESIKKRVAGLERRVKSLEQRANAISKGGKTPAKGGKAPAGKSSKAKGKGGKAPAKGGKAPPPGQSAQSGIVQLEGDATRVMLALGKKREKIPGSVPAGTYKIMATFGEAAPKDVGTLKVEPKKTKVVSCSAATQKCAVTN